MAIGLRLLVLTAMLSPAAGLAKEDVRTRICGVGIGFEKVAHSIVINRVVEGSPAEVAGIKPGSMLVAIDGNPAADTKVPEVAKRLSGKAGEAVTLRVCEPDGNVRNIRVVRAEFTVPGKYGRGVRIDYILASPSLAERCTGARVVNDPTHDYWSDHYPVLADFSAPDDSTRGPDATSGKALRVITYNVLEGFRQRPERKAEIANWLKQQEPAVVAFQELNGFSKRQLGAWARTWGHEHVRILKNKGYSTGITSSAPITEVEKFFDGHTHGLMRCRTHDIMFCIVHLPPGQDADKARLAEAKRVLSVAGKADDVSGEAVILGDFNATSTSDRPVYAKLGIPERPGQFDVMEAFRKAGWIDLAHRHRQEDAPIISVPSPLALLDRSP